MVVDIVNTEDNKKGKKTGIDIFLIAARVIAMLIFMGWLLIPKHEWHMGSELEEYDDVRYTMARQSWRAPVYYIVDTYYPPDKKSQRMVYLYPYSYSSFEKLVKIDKREAFITIDL